MGKTLELQKRNDNALMSDVHAKNAVGVFLKAALAVARCRLPAYPNKLSRKDYAYPQIAACVLLMEYLGVGGRRLVGLLRADDSIRRIAGLMAVPSYLTCLRCRRRLGDPMISEMTAETLTHASAWVRSELARLRRELPLARKPVYYVSRSPEKGDWELRQIKSDHSVYPAVLPSQAAAFGLPLVLLSGKTHD